MIKIIADTTSSIPLDEFQALGVACMPQIIIFGEDSLRDDTEIDTATFLSRLKASTVLPKTAAPPPALYAPVYQQAKEAGDSVLVICPSAELSGTVRSATVAAQEFAGSDIRIVDTQTVGSGLGMIVRKAVQWANQGLGIDELEAKVRDMSHRERVYFLVATLEYLHKGGRIGNAQALLGGLLQVKPILTLKNGKAEPAESQRTKKRALARLSELVQCEYPASQESCLSIMHADADQEAAQLAEQLSQMFNVPRVPIYQVPPAIVVHAGPGVMGVSFFMDKPNGSIESEVA
jgi:DegV family protein with EDD domain